MNLGEVLVGGNQHSKLDVTANLQKFALIVTDEPYDAVHQPSDVVVLENIVRADTKGTAEAVSAKYELMERADISRLGTGFTPWFWMRSCPWNFSRRGTHFASLNPREPRHMPATPINMQRS